MKKYISKRINILYGNSHRYETEKGIISCVHPCEGTFNTFEIYCIKGRLFDDVERYDTLEDAENRIKQLLQVKTFIKNLKK